jgi:ligand-binding sensor domain-containing protein
VRHDGKDAVRLTRSEGIPSRAVLAIAGLRDGRILVGTSAGAAIVDGTRATRIVSKTAELGNVWAVAETADGALWLGTTTGVYRGFEREDTWQRFSLATGHLRDDWVMALVARDDTVWAGTYKGGVTRFDAAGTVTATQLGDGWINPNGLVLDGDRLLASTMDGLLAGDGRTAAWTTTPGLPGKDVTATIRAAGARFVATRRGLAELR